MRIAYNKSETAVLYINKSESRCGSCDGGADPYELSHETLLGWYAMNDKMQGCGAKFISVSTDYINFPGLKEAITQMRPDLPYFE